MAQLHLRGGQVVDGTGAPRARRDVQIAGGRIVVVGPDLTVSGDRVDCDGLLIAPGFIDTHSHSDLKILVEPDLPMKVSQGITLDVLGQDGISVAPVRESDLEQSRRQLAGLLGDPSVERKWRYVGDYLDVLDRTGAALHTAYLVPHGAARAVVMGHDNRAPTQDELAKMVALVGKGMEEGALGMSTGLIYPPCCYAATDELVALCTEVAKRKGVFVVHMRSESDKILEATDEMIDVARRSGVHLHISHFKIAGRRSWPLVEELIQKVEAAREEGVEITADQYPYVAGSTMLGAILPPWAHVGGVSATLERLASPGERDRMRAAMQHEGPNDWDNFWAWTGPEGIVLSDVPSGKRPEVVGKTVAQAAAAAGQGGDPLGFALDLLESERMGVSMISFSQTESVVARLMQLPWVNGCTDGLLGGRPHPRAFGAFPRFLGRYLGGRLTLEEMIRKLTWQAAAAMHLADRGRVAVGCAADLVVFDPARVMDRATFEDPTQLSDGIVHVFVGGEAVIRDGKPTGARPGRTVRRQVRAE